MNLAAPSGVPVSSVDLGTVTGARYDGAYHYEVVVRHEDGTKSWYAHLSSIGVSVGQAVLPATSLFRRLHRNVTGPHLHLEVRPDDGDPVEPLAALADRGVDL